MSISALKLAARNQIRSTLITAASPFLPGAQCDLEPDGRPGNDNSPIFISVHGGQTRGVTPPGASYLRENVGFEITCSFRLGQKVTAAHEGEYLDRLLTGIDTTCRLIIRALLYDSGITLLTAANTLITGTTGVQDRVKHLFVVGAEVDLIGHTHSTPRTAQWWNDSPRTQGPFPQRPVNLPPGRQNEGYSSTISFGNISMYSDDSDMTFS